MIPSLGNHYLNMNCSLDESLQDALRLRMLSQEDTFKNQVNELHRLYQIQTMLMKNSQMKGVATEQLVNCTSQGMLHRPLRNINQSMLNKRDGLGTRENPVQVDSDDGDTETSMDEVKLSLSIGVNTTKRKRSGSYICSENVTSVSFQEIIDIEESIHTKLGGNFGPGDLQVSKSSCFSEDDRNKDLSMIMRSESLAVKSITYAEQNSAGATKGLGEVPSVRGILPPLTKVLTSHEELIFDLNEPPVDESVFDPKGLEVMECSSYGHTDRVAADIHSKLTLDVGTSWRISNNNCSNEVSGTTQQDNLDTVMMASDSNKSSPNSQQENSDFGSTVAGGNDKVMSDQNAVFTNLCSGVDIVEDRDSSLASSKTGQSGIYTEKSDTNCSPNSESSINESPSPDELKCGSSDEKREEGLPVDDPLLLRGAESLMSIFLASSRGECSFNVADADDISNEIHMNQRDTYCNGNKKLDKPQCSSDSYESTVLKQKECSEEDYCVSSTHMDLIIPDNKDFGVKLRRGRRMKDFQKDILPSLASLSKQEISEDVRLMDGILRSREYKRLRSQAAKAHNVNWFTPVRSRRSKLNHVGRKFS